MVYGSKLYIFRHLGNIEWTESNEGSENLKLFISLHDLFNFQTL